jgi:hypothetical protein
MYCLCMSIAVLAVALFEVVVPVSALIGCCYRLCLVLFVHLLQRGHSTSLAVTIYSGRHACPLFPQRNLYP